MQTGTNKTILSLGVATVAGLMALFLPVAAVADSRVIDAGDNERSSAAVPMVKPVEGGALPAPAVATPLFTDDPVAMQTSVREALNRMRQTMQTMNYRGVFVFQQGGRLDTMKVVHRATALGEQERLVSLDGQPMEIVRKGGEVMLYLPQLDGTITASSQPRNPFTVALPNDLDSIAKNYQLAWLGMDRVAGRLAHVVAIQPNDTYRYGYRLWLDQQNYMLLKAKVGQPNQAPEESMLFTQIEYPEAIQTSELVSQYAVKHLPPRGNTAVGAIESGPVLEPVPKPVNVVSSQIPDAGTAGGSVPNADTPNDATAMVEWQAQQLPQGFVESAIDSGLRTANIAPSPADSPYMASVNGRALKNRFAHRTYSDGLASISVFVNPFTGDTRHLHGGAKIGALHAYGRKHQGYQITVIGDVPAATVSLVADGVTLTVK